MPMGKSCTELATIQFDSKEVIQMWSIRVTDENGEVFIPRSFENRSDDDVVDLLIAAELMYPHWQMELIDA